MKNFLFLIAVLTLTSCLAPKEPSKVGCSVAADLFDDYWKWSMETFPTYASMMNYGERHNKLFETTVENMEKVTQDEKGFLKRVREASKNKRCSEKDKENLMLLEHKLTESIEGSKFKTYYVQFESMGGPHTWMPQLFKRVPLKTLQNYKDYLERLSQIPKVFEQAKAMSLLGVKEGVTPPKVTF